ncbi:ABC transporter substrate-binding protein [Bdellovibrio sp. NC01]|uniref:substrate-binding periplasmic protein n=1 Tax=Bdellovibrio sp. NC01 TaxID=2220073 RepID=UPI00115B59A1|nr:transporter substrate-binding domain-containing protein [Bdellovibrio sp. NC01]QDK37797.1 amino acid ABC transporter substrate-binding protein [Bdellovibrio sp. NC01]
MPFFLNFLFIGVLVLLGSASSAFAKTLKFSTFPIPLMVESKNSGIFIELTKEIAKRNNLNVEVSVTPPSKSILIFANGKADAWFPAAAVSLPKKSARSIAFYAKTDFIFYRKGKPYKSIAELEGKKVGLTFRYPYMVELTANKKISFDYSSDDISNMKKLSSGQIDAFVVEERSGLKALELSGVKNIEYDVNKPLSRQEIFYAFQDNEEGRALAQTFSKTITKMKSDGAFDSIMSSHQPKILE